MTRALALLLFSVAFLYFTIGAAHSANVTTTKKITPDTIWLFVSTTPAAAGKAPYAVLYWFIDEKLCKDQADKWNLALPAVKALCLPLDNKGAVPGEPFSSSDE